jgi:N-methylhydantoinase A
VAEALGLESPEVAAGGIVDIVNENMLGGIRLVSVQQGFDPRDFALVAFGGAGPLHANALGRLTGAWPVIIPPSPGVLSALGDATTSLRDEAARTVLRRFADLPGSELTSLLRELADEAGGRLAEQGLPPDAQTATYQVDVRYHGQGFEIPIDVPADGLADPEAALSRLAADFDAEHQRLFSFLLRVDHEIVNARATVTGPRPDVAPIALPEGDGDPTDAVIDTHPVFFVGEQAEAHVYDRGKLRAGDIVPGPAIVIEMDSTTLVLPDHAATVHPSGSLLINPASNNVSGSEV